MTTDDDGDVTAYSSQPLPRVEREVPDLAAMRPGEMLTWCGADAARWADAFMALRASRPDPIDWDDMVGWFANAIEHSVAVRLREAYEDAAEICRRRAACGGAGSRVAAELAGRLAARGGGR